MSWTTNTVQYKYFWATTDNFGKQWSDHQLTQSVPCFSVNYHVDQGLHNECILYGMNVESVYNLYLAILTMWLSVCVCVCGNRLLERLMSLSPKSQVMFVSAFSWISDFFRIFGIHSFQALFTRRVHMNFHAHKLCSAHELCTRAEPCDWSAGAHGVTTMLGVSLRIRRHATQVMLGSSLRARWDTILSPTASTKILVITMKQQVCSFHLFAWEALAWYAHPPQLSSMHCSND